MDKNKKIKIVDKMGIVALRVENTEIPYITKYSIEASDRFTRKIHIDLEIPIEELDVNIEN